MSRAYDTAEYRRERKVALKRDGYTCRICNRPWYMLPRGKSSLHVDHRVPVVMGGSNKAHNLVTLCAPCHGRKDGGRRYR